MSYRIDRNVPLPAKQLYGQNKKPKYPFMVMNIGDSFAVPEDQKRNLVGMLQAYMRKEGKALARQYTCRSMPNKTYRCWRIK